MSIGTIYYRAYSSRYKVLSALADSLDIDVAFADASKTPEFIELFPMSKIPALVTSDGFKLTETPAILNYLILISTDENTQKNLLGKNIKERADIIRWCSLSNNDLNSALRCVLLRLDGKTPHHKEQVDAALEQVDKIAQFYETRLKESTFLTAERITAGDIMSFGTWSVAFSRVCGTDFQIKYPCLVQWFNAVKISKCFKKSFADFKFIEKINL